MFERPKGTEAAILVHIQFPAADDQEDLTEFQELVISAGAQPVALITGSRKQPEAKYFVGTGKAEEIGAVAAAKHADVIIFNHSLSPAQERNLEQLCRCRVIDRTRLILDIFAQRARTFEGKLQVELAQLRHMATRLVRGWTHLERQKGGIGLRGPGETQLETDRRLLRAKIKTIEKRLEKVEQQRNQNRRARQRAAIPTVSLIGYTNVGKSSLFNRLTGADAYVANQLFATLDPTIRRLDLPELGPIILADTVGFIRHLPHDLIKAFRATLEETRDATLLLQVIDVTDAEKQSHNEQVYQVLKQVGAADLPILQVYNKIDQVEGLVPKIDRDENGKAKRVWISVQSGQGLDLLTQAIVELLGTDMVQTEVVLTPDQGRLRAKLYELDAVLEENIRDNGDHCLQIRLNRVDFIKWFH